MRSYIEGVKVYDGTVYFNDWLLSHGYKKQAAIKDDLVSDGFSEEEIEEQVNELYDQFEDWADENDLVAASV